MGCCQQAVNARVISLLFDGLERAFACIKGLRDSLDDPTLRSARYLHSLNLKCDGMFSLKSKASLMKLSKQSFRFHLLIEKMIIHLDPVKATTRKPELNQRVMRCVSDLLGVRTEMIGQKQARND